MTQNIYVSFWKKKWPTPSLSIVITSTHVYQWLIKLIRALWSCSLCATFSNYALVLHWSLCCQQTSWSFPWSWINMCDAVLLVYLAYHTKWTNGVWNLTQQQSNSKPIRPHWNVNSLLVTTCTSTAFAFWKQNKLAFSSLF